MAKSDITQSDGPDVIDRRKLLTAAAAMAAGSTIPKVSAAETVADFVQSSASPPQVQAPIFCPAMARRLVEINRRNELRREAQLPLVPIAQELRRMKREEELEALRRFEAANGRAVWEQVLEARRQAEGNSNWRPNWMEGVRLQNQVYAALRARFGAGTQSKKFLLSDRDNRQRDCA